MDSSGKQSAGAHDYGFEKFGAEGLLASSVGLGWSGLSAELLTHGRGWVDLRKLDDIDFASATRRKKEGVMDLILTLDPNCLIEVMNCVAGAAGDEHSRSAGDFSKFVFPQKITKTAYALVVGARPRSNAGFCT